MIRIAVINIAVINKKDRFTGGTDPFSNLRIVDTNPEAFSIVGKRERLFRPVFLERLSLLRFRSFIRLRVGRLPFRTGRKGIDPRGDFAERGRVKQNRSRNGACACLKNFERKFQDGALPGPVGVSSADRVPRNHEDRACKNPDDRPPEFRRFAPVAVRDKGDRDRLESVRNEGDEHSGGIEEKVSQKGTRAAYDKGGKGIEKERGKTNRHVV